MNPPLLANQENTILRLSMEIDDLKNINKELTERLARADVLIEKWLIKIGPEIDKPIQINLKKIPNEY